ncbi:carbohydrate ABC transporter permease [Pseudogracilibacillus auburnensis]|uniref:Carbohydrate ABC transporter membrane protein 1 (CUT1 family) n=1 Tax=Pseudogracilibacillus auburnensis TaxID=1494959 RepID=A0A2V3W163_9BACI|nr:sugar ABC transporter permease [Pseudogracilibacillus auburnensis]PXW85995.1 carbohydrate ABC transporter membrane protein 1 (CUT1 family) [Pseudogracilibacillus auburnensis]
MEKRQRKLKIKKHLVHLFLLPAVLLYGIFQLYPLITAALNSLYSFNGFDREKFIGFKNFVTLFTEKPYNEFFFNAISHNWIYFFVTVITQLIVSLILALIIHSKIKGKEFFKSVFFLPKLLSVIVIGFLFSLILNPTRGALNNLLEGIGLEALTRPWLGSMDTALFSIIFVDSWASIGFSMLIFLAGLQAIDNEIFEAARIDGANTFTVITRITLPMLAPALMVMSVLVFIGSFETFEYVFAMQGSSGGPYYSTDVLTTFFYRLAFGTVDGGQAIGLGSAVAVVLFIIIGIATCIILFFFKKKDFER